MDVHEVVPDVPDDIAPDQTAEADVAHVDAVRRSRNETAGQRLDPAVDHKRPVACIVQHGHGRRRVQRQVFQPGAGRIRVVDRMVAVGPGIKGDVAPLRVMLRHRRE